jgi:hypothetical protein
MTVLDQIKASHLKVALDTIVPIFEKACRYIASHSQPLETLSTRPDLTELKEDWAELQAARDTYRKSQFEVPSSHQSLKPLNGGSFPLR